MEKPVFESNDDFLKPENVNKVNKVNLREKYGLPASASDDQILTAMALRSDNPEGVLAQMRFRLSQRKK